LSSLVGNERGYTGGASNSRLDKQGATSLKEEKKVDAIVRPQLTNQISIQSPIITIQLSVVVFVQQEKF
jgi:hypothetical protein